MNIFARLFKRKIRTQHSAPPPCCFTLLKEKIESLDAAISAAQEGKDFTIHLRRQKRKQLEAIQCQFPHDVSYVRVSTEHRNGSCCHYCHGLEGQLFLLSDELENPSIPIAECTGTFVAQDYISLEGFCRCNYEPVFNDEL